jgi:DNA-binding response OmpR family regulator
MKKILLVEDDPNLGLLLQDYLQIKGNFEVVLCTDGDEGYKAFGKDNFDLCILDVMMPKKDGFTLGKEIRKANEHVPIIFATAKSMMEDKSLAYDLGGDDYITKPFRIEELLLRINALLKRASLKQNVVVVTVLTILLKLSILMADSKSYLLKRLNCYACCA